MQSISRSIMSMMIQAIQNESMAPATTSIQNQDIDERLIRHLQAKNEVLNVSRTFATLETNEARVSLAYELLEENALLPNLAIDGKSDKKSLDFRCKGNEMFKEKKLREALECYTRSVACAKVDSENLALAYANRSAVLFEIGLYEECLKDIDLALKNHYPENLKQKLLTRQSKAKDLSTTQTPVAFFTPVPSIPTENRNTLLQGASDAIKIEYSAGAGRHIVATRNIPPGEIIAIEKPYCQLLLEEFFIHCHHCLKLCYNLLPCTGCTQTLHCSEACQKDAAAYHQYECPILLTVHTMKMGKLKLLPMKIAILIREKYGKLDQCVLDKDGVYRSDRYEEIHNLISNEEQRSVSDLFYRATTAAAIFHLIKYYTAFFHNQDANFHKTFKELVLFHMQTGPCNFHEITEVKSSDHSLDQLGIGAGAYSFLSMFNHSCCPNVVRYSYGSTLIAITIESIKKGQQCFDNYGYHHAVMPMLERKSKLKKQYFFDCTCTACINDYPLFKNQQVERCGNDDIISPEDLDFLRENNLEETQRIFVMALEKIKKFEPMKPNVNLSEWQEVFKQCCFIFRTIKTPI